MINEIDMIKNLSKSINQIMKDNELNIHGFAQLTGLTYAMVRNMKDAKIKKINAANLIKVANYFHLSPCELLGVEALPEELHIEEEYAEFDTSFFEREAGDFLSDNKCYLLKSYDAEYEECMINSIHYFVEAHKTSTGYYYNGIDRNETSAITKELVDKEKLERILSEYFDEDSKGSISEEHECSSIQNVNSVETTAKAIRCLREMYGITRKDLGKRTGLGEDAMYRIEAGINKKLNFEHIQIIAKELMCSTDFLLGESCDPTANRDGNSLFYHLSEDIVFRHVQLGHDLAYASNYMDDSAKSILTGMIDNLNLMYQYKKNKEDSFGERLSTQEVFFREQRLYKDKYKNRGARFYTQRYNVKEGE